MKQWRKYQDAISQNLCARMRNRKSSLDTVDILWSICIWHECILQMEQGNWNGICPERKDENRPPSVWRMDRFFQSQSLLWSTIHDEHDIGLTDSSSSVECFRIKLPWKFELWVEYKSPIQCSEDWDAIYEYFFKTQFQFKEFTTVGCLQSET